MNFLVKLLVNALMIFALAWALPGVDVTNFWVALVVAVILSLLNVILKPILIILTIPITIVTLGLFLLVINAVIILIADSVIGGFSVNGFWWALLFSLLLSVLNSIFEKSGKEKNQNY